MGIILWLVIGGVIGWLASIIMRTDAQQGIFLNIVVGVVGAFLGGLLFTGGDARVAGSIAGTEVVTKIALFYFHERAWSLVHWGRRPAAPATGRADEGIAPAG